MTSKEQQIIEPIDKELIKLELTDDLFLCNTKSGSNKLYFLDSELAPNTMLEIGRLRELTFRESGGGTGKSYDIDEDDTAKDGYKQLIVWNPQDEEIIGGYRYIVSNSSQTKNLSTEHYFTFTDKFREKYLPYMIELGRSFIQPKYQSRKGGSKAIFALDNLWEGIGLLAVRNKHVKYFFGKVTMYVEYNDTARSELIYFLRKYFADNENLLQSKYPIEITCNNKLIDSVYSGGSFKDDYKILVKRIRENGENIPPLVNAYMNISPSLKVFDTVINPDFGGVEETGMMVTIEDMYLSKYERYISSQKTETK